jgi:serine/threonine-protein phosphatase 2B catalytic subunit
MVNIQQFNYSPHPFILPQFMNIFNWSIPFVSEKSMISIKYLVNEMLLHVIKKDFDDMGSGSNSSTILEENLSKY